MFTGIIKSVGRITKTEPRGGDLRLCISAEGLPWDDYSVGDSIAVNGVCLTAVALRPDGFDTDVSTETLTVTTLGTLGEGSKVNLEPALAIGERLGGHLVSGHVDGIGTIVSMRSDGRAWRCTVQVPHDISRYIAKKGSVSIDGVSLTTNEVFGNSFAVTIIPHTFNETIFRDYKVGAAVNIEVDMMARYLERLTGADEGGGITTEFLQAHGYG